MATTNDDTESAPSIKASEGLAHPDAADEPEDFCRRRSQAIQHELAVLVRQDPHERLAARLERYRRLG